MKKSSMTNILSELAGRCSNSLKLVVVNCQNSPTFWKSHKMRSCLLVQKNFRFKVHQKRILLYLFMKGKNSGKKENTRNVITRS